MDNSDSESSEPKYGPASERLVQAAKRFWWMPLVIVAVLVSILTSNDEPTELTSDDEPPGTLEVGECTDRPAEDVEYFQVNEVNCSREHGLEVFALVDAQPAADEPFPGHDEAASEYERLCTAEFDEYVGASPGWSEFSVYTVYPGKSSWDDGFTEGICLLGRFDSTGNLLTSVGSARGSGA